MDRFNNKYFIIGVFVSGIAIIVGLLLLVIFVIIPFFVKEPARIVTEPIGINVEAKNIVGIWNNSETLGVDWNDRYHFWESGKYAFYFNRLKDPKNRVIGYYGYWKIDAGKLIINPAVEIVLSGGSYNERALTYVGAETVEKNTAESRKELQFKQCTGDDSQRHKCFILNNEKFYLFSTDPSNYLGFKIESEPNLAIAKNITENISGNYTYKETGLGQTWNYKLSIYMKDVDFLGDLKITGPETNINVVTKVEGQPNGKLNILFDSYKEGNTQKLYTKCYRKNCGREAKTGDVLFSLDSNYRITWGEYYPYTDKSKDSKTEFFVKK